MLESYSSFDDYVRTYKLERSEGVLLRHLSQVFKVLAQSIPVSARTEEVEEAEVFLLELLKGVDSSLIEEWERLRQPELLVAEVAPAGDPAPLKLTADREGFLRLVRHEIFAHLKRFAVRDCSEAAALEDAVNEYFDGHQAIRLDPEARNRRWTAVEVRGERGGEWLVEQTLIDPEEANDWSVTFVVDLAASDEAGAVVLRVESLAAFAG
jgi:hypothetical protein